MPSTRPNLALDREGICSACRAYEARATIDWDRRHAELLQVVGRYRRNGRNWDCIVPVSGGKDSTFQVVRMQQLGLRPLCVTATTCDLSPVGRRNLENIAKLGVDPV